MNKQASPQDLAQRRLALLRDRYHAYLASKRVQHTDVPDEERRGKDGAREGSVAGKETRRGMRQGIEWACMTQEVWRAFNEAWIQTPEDVLFWSDLHLGHENIIKYTQRPYGGVFHMDNSLLANAQAAVKPGQWLLFVGDLAMWKERAIVAQWMAQCPGRKLLVLGNHDLRGRERPVSLEDWQSLGFEAVADVAVLAPAHGHKELWLTHYPLPKSQIPEETLNLHGHTHTHLIPGPFVNACVEIVGYRPRNLKEILDAA